jgi:phosphomannomutase
MPAITLGTEGWRALLADDCTFANVRLVARAAGTWFKEQPQTGPVAVGHETPSAISVAPDGAKWIENEANRLVKLRGRFVAAPQSAPTRFDNKEEYLSRVLSLVGRRAIAQAKLRVVADMMHGAGCGYFDEARRRVGCAEVKVVRGDPDPTFDWQRPEPIGKYLEPSAPLTADPLVNVGLATDGDADRFGMMAEGEYFDRIDADILREQRKRLARRIPKLTGRRLAGQKVAQINHLDGAKFICEDGSWLLARLSGTEALVRVYAEAWPEADPRALLEDGRRLILKAAER